MTGQAKLDAAIGRFEEALAQVEASFARLAALRSAGSSLEAENAELKERLAALEAEVATLRQRATEMADIGRQALVRIDKAMERVRAVLGDER